MLTNEKPIDMAKNIEYIIQNKNTQLNNPEQVSLFG